MNAIKIALCHWFCFSRSVTALLIGLSAASLSEADAQTAVGQRTNGQKWANLRPSNWHADIQASALSHAFLIAGARRVVSANWLIDDEAAANLVSVFFSIVARERKKGEVDYAAALQKAKQWVRKHPDHAEWKQPYYRAPFVPIGPH